VTSKQALKRAREMLTDHKVENPLIESELLLRHALDLSRIQLYIDLDKEIPQEKESAFFHYIERRISGEPTTYIVGHKEFYGLDFYVDKRVLIPRPETELLVEKTLNQVSNGGVNTIADIGTGCGAIAISIAINIPDIKIYAVDISPSSLDVAEINCRKHAVTERICLIQGDMLKALPEPVDLIIANLPYVKSAEIAQTDTAGFEPYLALDGGLSGLEKIFELCRQSKDKINPDGCILLEIGFRQKDRITTFLTELYPSAKITVIPDFSSIDRVIKLELPDRLR